LIRDQDRQLAVHLEREAGVHIERATVAWCFDLAHWGRCGLGEDEASALAALAKEIGLAASRFEVVERIAGDERAFQRDRLPATAAETQRTVAILRSMRPRTMRLVASATADELDWRDPERRLSSWARWHSLRQIAWHLADTESRYYLPSLGERPLPRGGDLLAELDASHRHVLATIAALPPDRIVRDRGGEWTTVKLLRRLAWHERSELRVMRRLLSRARTSMARVPEP
jgi:hypothetical protein